MPQCCFSQQKASLNVQWPVRSLRARTRLAARTVEEDETTSAIVPAMEVMVCPLSADTDRQAPCLQQDEARTLKPPCAGEGGGSGDDCERGPHSGDDHGQWPPGECGDVTPDGPPPHDVVEQPEEAAFSDSVSTEYLTPAGSLFSLEFCSTLDMLAEEDLEEKEVECGHQQPTPPQSVVTPATPSSSSRCSLSSPASPSLEEDERDEPVARILDVCGQRVDFHNTPSALSLLSDASSVERSYFLGQGYRSLASSASDSSTAPSSPSKCSRPATVGVNSSNSSKDSSSSRGSSSIKGSSRSSSAADTLSRRSQKEPGPPSSLSPGKLLPWLHDPLEPRIKQRRRAGWTRLWTAFCRRMQQWVLRRRHGRRMRRRANDGGQRLCDESQVGSKDDDNVSSDDFYTVTARWDLCRLYQRCVSYLHGLWCRNGS